MSLHHLSKIQNLKYGLLFILFFLSKDLFSQQSERNDLKNSALSGYWNFDHLMIDLNCKTSDEAESIRMEEYSPRPAVFIDFYILADSIYWIDYPCVKQSKSKYTYEQDTLFWNGGYAAKSISVNQDTIALKLDSCTTAFYYRANKNQDSLAVLMSMDVNPVCIAGVYNLITEFKPEYPAYDQAHVEIPPVKMPKEIDLSDYNDALAILEKPTIILKIGKQEREFIVIHHDFCNWDMECKYFIELAPGYWWTGEPFTVQYRSQ